MPAAPCRPVVGRDFEAAHPHQSENPATNSAIQNKRHIESIHRFLDRYIPRRNVMAWKTPRIVEIAVGMEINTYACADL
jgi:coenzyme PQQ precursor peptide PqqA